MEYARGTHTLDDVREMVERDEAHFWPGERAAIVTEFHDYPRLRSLHFWLCGGDLKELIEQMRPVVEAWGQAHGCTRFTTAGRRGWMRTLAPYGYEPAWHVSTKEVK